MKISLGIICAELLSIGRPEKVKSKVFRKLTFRNIDRDDRREYTLYIVDGYTQSKKFLKFPPGAKLKNIKIYEDKQKFYVDVLSDAQEIKARPLF